MKSRERKEKPGPKGYYPGEEMVFIGMRLPVRLRNKLKDLSRGRSGEWVSNQLEKATEDDRLEL